LLASSSFSLAKGHLINWLEKKNQLGLNIVRVHDEKVGHAFAQTCYVISLIYVFHLYGYICIQHGIEKLELSESITNQGTQRQNFQKGKVYP